MQMLGGIEHYCSNGICHMTRPTDIRTGVAQHISRRPYQLVLSLLRQNMDLMFGTHLADQALNEILRAACGHK